MFATRYFAPRYFTGRYWPPVVASVDIDPTKPGLEYTLPINRLQCRLCNNKLHFTLPINRLKYSMPEEDR